MTEDERVRYKIFVEDTETRIGRKLQPNELSTIEWLCGRDAETAARIKNLICDAFNEGKKQGGRF